MKRFLSFLLSALLIFPFAAQLLTTTVGFTDSAEAATSAFISGADSAMVQFAANEISEALKKQEAALVDADAEWTICFLPVQEELGEQCFEIRVSGRQIEIAGGDERGLMYGGLEAAEQIALYGIEAVTDKCGAPYVKERGMLCPVPMDMRSPSYNTPGDAGQKNIGNVWEMDFWHEYLDNLARNRMNVVQVWTVNSFASMVKVDGYEDIALNDVWRTKVPLDNSFKGDLSNAIRPEDWENYEVVKAMTIEEKIEFWQEVMAYAKDRGIDFLFLFRHLYTYAEDGKYGITHDPHNPVLKDYLGKSMKAFVETYPDLMGVGLNPGENMGWDNSEDSMSEVMQWLHDIYVPNINEALAKTPGREFQLMLQEIPKQSFADMYADLNCKLTFVRGYTSVHMYATSTPKNCYQYVDSMPEGTGLWLNCRNEDCFDMRWGDPDFMADFVNNIPADKVIGLVTGSDGYFYGRDYSSTDPDFQGQMYMKKHWYNYMLLARLMYENDMSRERIFDIFSAHYNNMAGTDIFYEATSVAGKIIPQVHQIYFQDNGDYTWFVSGSWSHPNTFGYLDIKRWMKSNNPFKDGNAMSIEEYALRISNKDDSEYTTQTPQEISDILAGYGNDVLAKVGQIRSDVQSSENMSFAEKEFWALVSDDEAMAYLGLYYSEKIMGAVELRIFNDTKDETWKESSVNHLQKAAEYFTNYAGIISDNYVPQHLARVGHFDINEILESVRKDVQVAENWKPKRITPSWNPPSKSEYFGGSSNG